MLNKLLILIMGALIFTGCANSPKSVEPWVDYSKISKIEVGVSPAEVVSSLGDPLLKLSEDDAGDIIVYYFYNYHVNRFILVENNTVGKIRDTNLERNILLKFTFEEGSLVSWEEDKLTLAMSMKNRPRSSSMLKYFSYLLNIILAIQLSNS